MGDFTGAFWHLIAKMLDYREALGFSRRTHLSALMSFDRYSLEHFPGETTITKDMALGWINKELEKYKPNISEKATALRLLSQYIAAIGQDAYLLPKNFVARHTDPFTPYIFTDSELTALFDAIDNLREHGGDHTELVAPVMFRLIYTCGLRPNEGRLLEREAVNLETGEITIVKTKRKKDRIAVMSDDMLALCKEYNRQRETFACAGPFFFPCGDGQAYDELRLNRMFKRAWELANPSIAPDELPSVRVYDLRHRFASAILNRWLDEGRNLNAMTPYLRSYMGHDKMDETAHYIHILPENLTKSRGVDFAALNSLIPNVRESYAAWIDKGVPLS